MNEHLRFPEDGLALLSKPIEEFSYQEYYGYIQDFYAPMSASGKQVKPLPKGKFLSRPTKGPKRPLGDFQLSFNKGMGEVKLIVKYNREAVLENPLPLIAKKLTCESEDLQALFEKKGLKWRT
jgi:hypothetical protein